MSNFLRSQKVAMKISTPDNVWILSLIENHKNQPQQSAYLSDRIK
jgi:hypothetical protein